MLLNEPGRTNYDLNFNLFGFNVRTHPAFFIMPILLGQGLISPDINTGVGWLLLIAIFWVSILVHELGHAIAFRYYGIQSRIVLYWMGGLAIPDSGNVWSSRRTNSLSPGPQIVVSLAGPVAGLMLGGVLCLLVYALRGSIVIHSGIIPVPVPDFSGTTIPLGGAVWMVFYSGILINLFLNILNLVPIYPLDGGQIARQVMLQMDSHHGLKNSLILSMAACAVMILFSFKIGGQFMAIFFAFMAWSNYQSLQSFGGPRW